MMADLVLQHQLPQSQGVQIDLCRDSHDVTGETRWRIIDKTTPDNGCRAVRASIEEREKPCP